MRRLKNGARLLGRGRFYCQTEGIVVPSQNILQTIAYATQNRSASEQVQVAPQAMEAQARMVAEEERAHHGGRFAFPFEAALAQPGMAFICEVKKASPSKGVIAEQFNPLAIAKEYEAAGASAISCLTEPTWFLGSDEYLSEIAREVHIPVLRKDFIVNSYMIYQAKVLGASAVLLICSILSKQQLAEYIALAHELGMSALVEAYQPEEIPMALEAGARIVGVNNRDLRNFAVDFGRSVSLRQAVGPDRLFVSESGVSSRADVAQLEAAQADAVLIGEVLMRAQDKRAKLNELKGLA